MKKRWKELIANTPPAAIELSIVNFILLIILTLVVKCGH